ncbi:hypothetical protein GPECTOR_20g416 [Gonium pectorale]|uniref:PIH1 domain-containing protein 1 n=1 Tax=Gonium pectorale TaxID=33097 RepID=A0A150GIB0_GONPE|nr:hypothetical protein GPECTOR_20g416 [Gonium pectorale]|eukprot:KXZ49561.1 hypothetical protein GPECTOR_20g416 [Gonium pectorale]
MAGKVDLEKGLKDLKLTNEELNKFEKAFKDPEFVKLFEEYAKEVSDPKVKAETDMYLRQLEEQGRAEEVYGKGVQLVVPSPALVIKSKVLGPAEAAKDATGKGGGLPAGQKVFINICTSDKVGCYSLKDAKDAAGRVGKTLSIPLTLGPVRTGTDKHGQPASVYDFVVHPDSVQFANSNPAAFSSLAETALEHVEKVSQSRLSRGWRRLNIKYKGTEGCTEPPVQSIRTAEGGDSVGGRLRPRADVPGTDVPGAKSGPSVPAPAAAAATEGARQEGPAKGSSSRSAFSFDRSKDKAQARTQPEITDPAQPGYRHADGAVTPEWTLVHRGEADLAETWKDAGRGLALLPNVPKELLVRVTLPDVSSAGAVDLDVGQKMLKLTVPGRYQLSVPLPYAVDEAKGRAKLDKVRKQLEITLPVVPPPPPPAAMLAAAARGDGARLASGALVQELPGAGSVPAAAAPSSTGEEGSAAQAVALERPEAERGEGEHEADGLEGADASTAGEEAGLREKDAEAAGPTVAAQAGGGGRGPEGERQLTENERRWQEIHARAHAKEVDPQAGPSASAADADAGPGAVGAGGAVQGQADEEEAAGRPTGQPPAPAAAAPEELPPPTVLLRPRLQSSLAMELD